MFLGSIDSIKFKNDSEWLNHSRFVMVLRFVFQIAYGAYLIFGGHTVITRCGRWPSRQCRDQTCPDPFLSFVRTSLCFSFLCFARGMLWDFWASEVYLSSWSDVTKNLKKLWVPPDWYKRLESRWRMEGVDTVMTTRSWLHGHDSIMLNHTCPILFLLGHALVDKENDFTSLRPAARFVKVSCFGAEFCVWSRPWPGRNSKRAFIVWLRNWELFSVPKIASDLSRLSFVENSCGILVTVRQDSRIKEAILKPTSKNTANEL